MSAEVGTEAALAASKVEAPQGMRKNGKTIPAISEMKRMLTNCQESNGML
jgi:hypothetical protein